MTRKTDILVVLGLLVLALAVLCAIRAFAPFSIAQPYMYCVNNLRQIENAKEMYAEEYSLMTNGTIVTNVLLHPEQLSTNYIKHSFTNLVCPLGGKYAINRLSEAPTCSFQSQDKRHSIPSGKR